MVYDVVIIKIYISISIFPSLFLFVFHLFTHFNIYLHFFHTPFLFWHKVSLFCDLGCNTNCISTFN